MIVTKVYGPQSNYVETNSCICALSTNHQVPQYHALIISQIFLLIFTREEEVAVRPLWPLGILILVT